MDARWSQDLGVLCHKGGTNKKPVPSSLSSLEHQLTSEKDPEIRFLLQQTAALKKQNAAPASKELLVQDQLAKLKVSGAQPFRLAGQATGVCGPAGQGPATQERAGHDPLAKLPEEVLPAPKKIPMELLEPSLASLGPASHGLRAEGLELAGRPIFSAQGLAFLDAGRTQRALSFLDDAVPQQRRHP
eukprot:6211327-Amphidinium_carterae.1